MKYGPSTLLGVRPAAPAPLKSATVATLSVIEDANTPLLSHVLCGAAGGESMGRSAAMTLPDRTESPTAEIPSMAARRESCVGRESNCPASFGYGYIRRQYV